METLQQLRVKYEFYPCPESIISFLLNKEDFEGTIWEPCCGNGAIVKALRKHGYSRIIHTDIKDYSCHNGLKDSVSGIDFLATRIKVDNIITAPPFSLMREFIEHSLRQAKKVAMLLPHAYFKNDEFRCIAHMARIHKIDRQVVFHRGLSIEYSDYCAWYIWEKS